MISAERWDVLEPLLDAALALPPDRRDEYLRDACAGDDATRAELAQMLADCAHEDVLMERPAVERFAALWSDPEEEIAEVRTAVAAHYALGREVGRGGMGTVYLARDLRHERDVALKVLSADVGSGRGAARFLGEIRVTAQLRHPHILPLFDSGAAAGRLYYVAPYVEGGTLRDRLAREGALPVGDALQLLREIAGALAYAHAKGVVHRDIKPENILLGDGGAVLGDFGIARAVEQATRDGDRESAPAGHTRPGMGTPAYMAPEQAAGDASTDHRADLYSFGVVAYEVLTGRRPTMPPAPIAHERPEVPRALDALVARLLAASPTDRVQSAVEVVRAIDAIAAAPVHGAERHRDRQPPTRWRRYALLVAVLVAVALPLGAFARTSPGRRAVLRTLLTRGPGTLEPGRIVVAPFENGTGADSLDAFGEMVAEYITQELARTNVFEVVDARTALTTALVVDRFPLLLRPRDPTLALAEETGAGTVMSGTYYRLADSIRVLARLVDVASGRVVRASPPIVGSVDELSAFIGRVSRVAAAMAAAVDTSVAGIGVALSATPSIEAYTEMRQAWTHYYRSAFPHAFIHAARAAALDSTYVLPLIAQAYFHADLRQWAAVDSLVRRIERHERVLPPLELAAFAMVRAERDGDLEATLRAAEELQRLTPGSAEMGTHVAHLAVLVNRPRRALRALDALDPTRGVLLAAPFYWNWRTAALHEIGEHAAELDAAERGVRQFPTRNSTRLVLARALGATGRVKEIGDAAERATAERWPAPAVHRRALVEGSRELRAHGYRAEARTVLARAVATLPPVRDDDALAALEERALLLLEAEDWGAAYEQLGRITARAPTRRTAIGASGVAAARLGHAAVATHALAALASAQQRIFSRGRGTMWMARIAAALGDRAGALRLVRQAIDEGYPVVQGFAALPEAPDVFDYAEPSVHADPALASLFADPEFVRLLIPRD